MKHLLVAFVAFLAFTSACGTSLAPDASVSDSSDTGASEDVAPDQVVADRLSADTQVPDGTSPSDAQADVADAAPFVCRGCYLGDTCTSDVSWEHCGMDSACVRCPEPTDAQCQVAGCTDGSCSLTNKPDGTTCQLAGGHAAACSNGACRPCGEMNQTCCSPSGGGGACNTPLICDVRSGQSLCRPCGTDGLPCCPNDTCDTGATCNTTRRLCFACGGLNEPCCGSVCNGAQLACVNDNCSCGLRGQPCCDINGPAPGVLWCQAGEGSCNALGHCQ